MTLLERRRAMMQRHVKPKEKVYVFEFVNNNGGKMFDVKEGQTLVVVWDCPDGNSNGWVLNGNDCTGNIRRLGADVGYSGTRTLSVTQSGQVRVGAYSASASFSVHNGTITITAINP